MLKRTNIYNLCNLLLTKLAGYLCKYRYIFFTNKEFENTTEAIRIRKSKKDEQHNGQMKKGKRTNNIWKTLHRKLKIEPHEPPPLLP